MCTCIQKPSIYLCSQDVLGLGWKSWFASMEVVVDKRYFREATWHISVDSTLLYLSRYCFVTHDNAWSQHVSFLVLVSLFGLFVCRILVCFFVWYVNEFIFFISVMLNILMWRLILSISCIVCKLSKICLLKISKIYWLLINTKMHHKNNCNMVHACTRSLHRLFI